MYTDTFENALALFDSAPVSASTHLHCDCCGDTVLGIPVCDRIYGEDVTLCSQECLYTLTLIWAPEDTPMAWGLEFRVEDVDRDYWFSLADIGTLPTRYDARLAMWSLQAKLPKIIFRVVRVPKVMYPAPVVLRPSKARRFATTLWRVTQGVAAFAAGFALGGVIDFLLHL